MKIDQTIRHAAFNWLDSLVLQHGDVLPRSILEQGFEYKGQRITVIGPKGIWFPRGWEIPISITTTFDGPYDDSFTDNGLLSYRYQGTDPGKRDNIGLRLAMEQQIPLVYFHAIVKGKYLAVWPVFIVGDDPSSLTFTVAADDSHIMSSNRQTAGGASLTADSDMQESSRRLYVTASVRQRLHQRGFRERVLAAYKEHCAVCRFGHRELLDAAHIVPDSEPQGLPVVTNGLSLCSIHHAAYDKNFLGITPDYAIEIRQDLLEEHDGPMLEHGLQKLHNHKIILPSSQSDQPDRDRLAWRYERFKKAV
jgi:putative restriction endonuclease